LSPFWICALLACFGAFFGYANTLYHFPPAVLLFPGSLARIALDAPSAKTAFRRCLLVAAAAYVLCLYWVVVPVHVYGGLALPLALPCPVLLAFYVGLYASFWGYLLKRLDGKLSPVLLGLYAGIAWGALELIRGHALTGFSWLSIASAFGPWPQFIQGAGVLGMYGLGAVFVSVGIWLFSTKVRRPSILSVFFALAFLAYGFVGSLYSELHSDTKTSAVGIVQGNVDQSLKWDENYKSDTVLRYIRLSKEIAEKAEAEGKKLDLIVWPETAMPFYVQKPGIFRAMVSQTAKDLGVPIITGSPAYSFQPGSKDYDMHNRAWLFNARGEVADYYDKQHLVPFGEYVPYKFIFFFVDKLVEGAGEFAPGLHAEPLQIKGEKGDGLAPGMLICYESIFPELAQKAVESGADILVNISNDAWFGRTAAPMQHLHLTALRAVEQRRWIVRSTNTGISAFIDPGGGIHDTALDDETGGIFTERAFYRGDFHLFKGSTIFHHIHYVVHGLLLFVFLAGIVFSFRRTTDKQQKIS
jgi:apolipoprotein N-acyltransferase